ncbi:MAG: arsenic metallochaperone ArsD family protein [Thermoplasmata archaeon]|nr:arsenic metallochaperone ArsD family protein [Thermoplasmata archaeon]
MDFDMTVYESEAARSRDPADTERFERSYEALAAAGIGIRRVMCASAEDLGDGEAASIVAKQGMDALPICEYQGVDISVGQYPSDQDLADFLDVPDGVLSVDRSKPPAMGNDIQPACACRPVR